MNDHAKLDQSIADLMPRMASLLSDSLRIPSVSGNEAGFVQFIRDFALDAGLTAEMWETNEADLAAYPVAHARHLPLTGRPTLVVGLPNPGPGRSLIFNAHSDVVSAGREEKWTFGPWSGTENGGRVYGRGACDVKGPMVSALWAMLALHQTFPHGIAGRLQLELVPGEEDCVTLGTLTSLVKGHRADACIVLEPTECLPRNASRPGLRFEILCRGRAVHGTVKWLGEDAIALSQVVLSSLKELETRWNDPSADPLFSSYPIARPITVDTVRGGEWQGMICDECRVSGYLEILPNDEPADWMKRLTVELTELLDQQEQNSRRISVEYPETYKGHCTRSESSLCKTAEGMLESSVGLLQNTSLTWNSWSGFNSGCEAGLRANLENTPTLVWGPGSLAQAHAADEFIEFHQVETVARMFTYLGRAWTGLPKETL